MTFKLIKAGVAALALLAVPLAAQAADVPIKAPYYKGAPRSVVSYYNWTGFYAGVNLGYGMGTASASALPGIAIKPKGFLAGGTFGYNWQSGALVYGIEGDLDYSAVKGSVACGVLVTCEVANPWLATFRGRLGYAMDRWLPYVTAGAAYGKVKASETALGGVAVSSSSNQLGWAFGAGVEYAFMGSWTAKLEYLHVDLGHFDAGPAPVVNNVSFKENIIRAGLNYKFSGPIFSGF
jgi:outer membrane immunogenic protein